MRSLLSGSRSRDVPDRKVPVYDVYLQDAHVFVRELEVGQQLQLDAELEDKQYPGLWRQRVCPVHLAFPHWSHTQLGYFVRVKAA